MSTPPDLDGRTSLTGISIRATSSGCSGQRYVPTKPPNSAAPTLSGCLSVHSQNPISAGHPPHTNHEAKVKQPILIQLGQPTNLLPQQNPRDDSGPATPQTPTQRYRILDVDMCLEGKLALVMASEDVERDAGEEVIGRVERNVVAVFALALVRQPAVVRVLGCRFRSVDGDVELEVDCEGEADHVEARADVGGGAGDFEDKGVHRGGSGVFSAVGREGIARDLPDRRIGFGWSDGEKMRLALSGVFCSSATHRGSFC